jgi:hypothetical protein
VTARPGLPARDRRPRDGWRGSLPELTIAVLLVTAVAAAAYAWAGLDGAAMALGCCAIAALALFRLLPDLNWQPPPLAEEWEEPGQTSIAGFWRRRGVIKDSTEHLGAFETQLRPTLQHLLAARLSERHGISLYAEPEAARQLLLAGGRDKNLWYWLDPERPPAPADGSGIPPRTLAAIIHRLEQL